MERLKRLAVSMGSWARQRPAVAMALLLPLAVVGGAAAMRWQMTRLPPSPAGTQSDRPSPEARSVGDQVDAAAGLVVQQMVKTIGEAMAACGARSRGEALCYLAEQGNLEAVKYLLAQGERLNARDRTGRTALMGAAGRGSAAVVAYLLTQPGLDLTALDDHGNNAYVFARTRDDGGALARQLKEAGCYWPSLHQGEAQPTKESNPSAITERDILDWDKVHSMLVKYDWLSWEPAVKALSGSRPGLGELPRALEAIDLKPQRNEPELYDANAADYRQGVVLLVNRVLGTSSQARLLYTTEIWRDAQLPESIMRSIRKLREEHPEAIGKVVNDRKLVPRVRWLNGLIMDFVLGQYLQLHFGGGARVASETTPLPPERLPTTAPAFVREALRPDELEGKSLAQIQDMIDELLAAAGQRFPDQERNARYRAKGYQQRFQEPPLSSVQNANLKLLVDQRSQLREADEAELP